jgi:hypothetical protein
VAPTAPIPVTLRKSLRFIESCPWVFVPDHFCC